MSGPLDKSRRMAADRELAGYIFVMDFEGDDGWTTGKDADTWTSRIYLSDPDEPADTSSKAEFTVQFYPGTAVVEDAYATMDGNQLGHRAVVPRFPQGVPPDARATPTGSPEQGTSHGTASSPVKSSSRSIRVWL